MPRRLTGQLSGRGWRDHGVNVPRAVEVGSNCNPDRFTGCRPRSSNYGLATFLREMLRSRQLFTIQASRLELKQRGTALVGQP